MTPSHPLPGPRLRLAPSSAWLPLPACPPQAALQPRPLRPLTGPPALPVSPLALPQSRPPPRPFVPWVGALRPSPPRLPSLPRPPGALPQDCLAFRPPVDSRLTQSVSGLRYNRTRFRYGALAGRVISSAGGEQHV